MTAHNEELQSVPILLVGLIAEATQRSKYVSKALALEGLEVMNGLRYIEVTSSKNAKEVFMEAARILARKSHTDANKLAEVPQKLQKLIEKRSPDVILRKKNLTTLPNSFMRMQTYLRKLRLDSNRIQYFPEEILLCEELRELGLCGNMLFELPDEIMKLQHLVRLDLENNLLLNLPIDAVSKLSTLCCQIT